jgi:hypothetical protein
VNVAAQRIERAFDMAAAELRQIQYGEEDQAPVGRL